MNKKTVTYSSDTDSCYITIDDAARVSYSNAINDLIIADYDADDNIIGIEIVSVDELKR
jgi:uncharacterized protein YuzE